MTTAAVGLGSLAMLLGLRRVAPGVPAALAVVVAGIMLVALFDLADHGVEVIGRVEGAVPTPALPDVGWHDLAALLPWAMAVAVIGYAETATVAEFLSEEHRYTIRPDRELVATGVANALSGLFRGFITGGGPASRPPTTAPGPAPSWCRCWSQGWSCSPRSPCCRCSATCPRPCWGPS